MATDPKSFFNFLAKHYDLLKDLFDASANGGFNDAALYQMVVQSRSLDDKTNEEYTVSQLKKFNIIEECADSTSKLTMTTHLLTFLSFLFRKHRLTSVNVIRGYLQDIVRHSNELDKGISEVNDDLCDLALVDLSNAIHKMRHDSRNNRDALLHEALRLKQNREQLTTKQRFTIVNRLWQMYLNPMKEMIDVKAAMDEQLDALDRSLKVGLGNFKLNILVRDKINSVSSSLIRMRREVSADFRESLGNISPLYEALHRESSLARGAAAALTIAHKKGLNSLGINEKVGLSIFRSNDLMDCPSILDYLYQVIEYKEKSEPHKIHTDRSVNSTYYLSPRFAIKQLTSALPVQDGIGWLRHTFPEAGVIDVLRSYNQILRLTNVTKTYSRERKKIIIGELEMNYRPLSIKGKG